MRPELETYEQIDSFLNGELKGVALNSFQERIQNDVAFAEEVELQKIANEVVAGASFQDLRDQMSADISKIDASSTSSQWKFISIGLGFISISSAILYFSPLQEKPREKQSTETKAQTAIQKIEGKRAIEKINVKRILENEQVAKEQMGHPQFKQADSTLIRQSDVVNRLKDSIPASVKPVQDKQRKDTTTSAQPLKKETAKTVLNPCSGVSIEAHISTSASCADDKTGSIKVLPDIKGGTAPYTVRLDKSRISNNNLFSNLSADTYSISITDQAGCVKTYTIEVAEKSCNPKSFVFAPDKGEVWKYIGTNHLSYTLTILNMAGQQVFRTAQIQGTFEWQGYSQKGEYLDAGLYIYVAEYTDGSKENGQVTIAR